MPVQNKITSFGWNGLVIGFSTAQSQTSQPSSRTQYPVSKRKKKMVVIIKLGDSGAVLKFWLLYFIVRRTLCSPTIAACYTATLQGVQPWGLSSEFSTQCFENLGYHRFGHVSPFPDCPSQSQKQKPLAEPYTCSGLSCIAHFTVTANCEASSFLARPPLTTVVLQTMRETFLIERRIHIFFSNSTGPQAFMFNVIF